MEQAHSHPGIQLQTTWCVVCGSDDPAPYRRDMYAIGAERFHLVRCRQCGFDA